MQTVALRIEMVDTNLNMNLYKASTCDDMGNVWDSAKQTHHADLYGYGQCELQLCKCVEVRGKSMMWDANAKCKDFPNRKLDLILTFRLNPHGELQKKDLEPAMETFFTNRMHNLSTSGVLDSSFAPPWERLSSKLGRVAIPIEFLKTKELSCPVEDLSERNPLNLPTSGIAEPTVEFRSYSPINSLTSLDPVIQDKLIVPVLTSLVQDFRDFRTMDMTHCDRWEAHILLGKAPTHGNVPVAQIVDIDLMKEGFQAPRMAAWFGQSVYNGCLSPAGEKITLLDKLCEDSTPAGSHLGSFMAPFWRLFGTVHESQHEIHASLEAQLLSVEKAYHADPNFHGSCVGMANLVSRVVIPALNVALGKESAPEDWWAHEIDLWAKKFYGNNKVNLQSADDNDAVWTMLRKYESRFGHNWETADQYNWETGHKRT